MIVNQRILVELLERTINYSDVAIQILSFFRKGMVDTYSERGECYMSKHHCIECKRNPRGIGALSCTPFCTACYHVALKPLQFFPETIWMRTLDEGKIQFLYRYLLFSTFIVGVLFDTNIERSAAKRFKPDGTTYHRQQEIHHMEHCSLATCPAVSRTGNFYWLESRKQLTLLNTSVIRSS